MSKGLVTAESAQKALLPLACRQPPTVSKGLINSLRGSAEFPHRLLREHGWGEAAPR